MTAVVGAIFVLTYALIAARRLRMLPIGRPGGALLGAVAMVAVGALTPKESYAAIDHETIVLLFAMMLLAVYLEEAHFFLRIGSWLVTRSRTPWRLLAGFSLLAAVASAFLLNDTVCLFLTPLVVMTCDRAKLPMGPYLIALATSANIGSAATVVGNPQNILVGSMSGISFLRFLSIAAVPAAVGLAVNLALLYLYYRRSLPDVLPGELNPRRRFEVPTSIVDTIRGERRISAAVLVLAGVTVGFVAGLDRGYVALAGVMVMVLIRRTDPREQFARVDWPLLVFFAALFIVVAGFAKTGLVDAAWRAIAPVMRLDTAPGVAAFSAAAAIGSNIVSNVPLVLLAGPYVAELGRGELGWMLLAYTTTIAGNLTLVGSVANLIVAEGARDHYTLGFREYLRFGAVSTAAVLAAGVPALVAAAHWLR